MSEKDDELAFPRPFVPGGHADNCMGSEDWRSQQSQTGMTLRQWYAGQALPAVLEALKDFVAPKNSPRTILATVAAEASFAIADAMIAESRK